MKLVLTVLVGLLLAVLATLYTLDNPGYVVIARPPWSAEMSLVTFIALSLAAAAMLYLTVYLVIRLVRIPRDVAHWRQHRKQRQARAALYQGLTRLAEGNWVEAETELLAAMRSSETSLLAYLGAAWANQAQGNLEKRDEYLAGALRIAPEHAPAVGMTQANLQYLARQSERALATLIELRSRVPRNPHVLKLLAQLYLELRDWPNLVDLINDLRQHPALTSKEVDALELRAHRELLTLTLPQNSLEVLKRAWKTVPDRLKRDPSMIAIYARHLIQQREGVEAEQFLRAAIEQSWQETLVELYGLAIGKDPQAQLEIAEGWLVRHSDDARLLLTLGRLAVRAGNDTTARGYFERCIRQRGPLDAYRELGNILERTGSTQAALGVYRAALEQLSDERRSPLVRTGSGLGLRARGALRKL